MYYYIYLKYEPVWFGGMALDWQAEGSQLDSALVLLSPQKDCGLWTPSCDFVPRK